VSKYYAKIGDLWVTSIMKGIGTIDLGECRLDKQFSKDQIEWLKLKISHAQVFEVTPIELK